MRGFTLKLRGVQAEVLAYMAKGHRLLQDKQGGSWLDRVIGNKGSFKVHGNTVSSLRNRGLIEQTETIKFWRRDYVITEAGREAIG